MEIKRAALLIVSDEASTDPTMDRGADTLAPILAKEGKWELSAIRIVPNNVLQIQQALCDWTSGPNWHHLLFLSAAAALAVKDITPEAVTPLIHRHATSLFHRIIADSLEFTPSAKLERLVVDIREKTLIISLPQSSKGAMEDLGVVMSLLPHVIPPNPHSLHTSGMKKLNNETGVTIAQHLPQSQLQPYHHHHHAHGHPIRKAYTSPPDRSQSKSNRPAMGLNQRYRPCANSMLSVEEALRVIREQTPAPIVVKTPVTTSIIGSVIAEDVYASEMIPAYPTSLVDGYAIIAKEGESTRLIFHRTSIAHANMSGAFEPLQPGTIAKITAGTPLPSNANAVVMLDDIAFSTLDGQDEATVEILADDIVPGENVREPGSDVALNTKILARGDLISPVGGEIGLLAATGTRTVKVFKKCRVGVLSVGGDLVEHSNPSTLVRGQIRDSNRPSLLSCLAAWGFETVDLGLTRETAAGELEHTLRNSLYGVDYAFSGVDVLVITGSMFLGKLDFTPIIERTLDGSIHFNRVSMKPGMSTTFATVPFKATTADAATENILQKHTSKLIFSLPGDPASALATLNLFVLSSLHKFAGLGESSQAIAVDPGTTPQVGLPRVAVVLTHHFPLDLKRTEYHRAVVTGSRSDGRLYATSAGVNAVGSLAKANALVILRAGRGVGIKGEIVEALMMGHIHASDTRIIC
ncbi:hypothetical protein N7447_008494 [Penicillium robsamsonii]|uniref:uncharacterized protein n=1 Tax=Penicillium robsamsonii TaxID=1792511 RepID=UPI0025475F24|nr:uncharacterized protein N7447_008494 [Penicillium robsamsonii]KAJ5816261.1 hypothetical protein N7447_008494 [Penicillium robsamsonii]